MLLGCVYENYVLTYNPAFQNILGASRFSTLSQFQFIFSFKPNVWLSTSNQTFLKLSKYVNLNDILDYYYATKLYLKEKNFLRDKFLRFSRFFAKFVRLSPRRKNFFFVFRKQNLHFYIVHKVLYQLTMVMSKIFYRISNNLSRDGIERKM